MNLTPDVAIIGCGPVGALLANLLGLQGISVAVLEKQAQPYGLPRAVHFDDEAMRIFQTAGLAQEINQTVLVGKGMLFQDAAGKVLVDWSRDQNIGPQGWYESYRCHQPDIEAVLVQGLARFEHVVLHQDCQITSVHNAKDAVSLPTSDGQIITARYVIGADGAQSFLRQALGIELVDLGFQENWLVADLQMTGPSAGRGDYTIQYCDATYPATYVRGTGDRRRWEIRLPAGDSGPNSDLETWNRLSHWVSAEDATLERSANYTFRSCVAADWQQGRCFLVGDAAHQMPPFMGQGMCAGLRDVANLFWKLTAVLNGADAQMLDSYQTERLPNAKAFIELSVALGRLINQTAKGDTPDVKMDSLWPALGAGLGDGQTLCGMLAPQPSCDGILSDDLAKTGFKVLALSDLNLDVPVFNNAKDWLTQNGVAAVLVRPDGYVLRQFAKISDVTNAAVSF